jgi:hypothetical protein
LETPAFCSLLISMVLCASVKTADSVLEWNSWV